MPQSNFLTQLLQSRSNNVHQFKLISGDTIVATVIDINVQSQNIVIQLPFKITEHEITAEHPEGFGMSSAILYRLIPWFPLGNMHPIYHLHFSHVLAKSPADESGAKLYRDQVEEFIRQKTNPEIQEMGPQEETETAPDQPGLTAEERKKLN